MLEELQQYENDITDVLDILDAEDMLDVLQDIIDGEATYEDIKEDLERLVKEVPTRRSFSISCISSRHFNRALTLICLLLLMAYSRASLGCRKCLKSL